MKKWSSLMLSVVLLCAASCGPRGARSSKSFDEIRRMVQGQTTSEVERLLGSPDRREKLPISGEIWIWWSYTYLDGNDVSPEERGRVVHLQILFDPDTPDKPGIQPARMTLRAANPMAVSYILPMKKSL